MILQILSDGPPQVRQHLGQVHSLVCCWAETIHVHLKGDDAVPDSTAGQFGLTLPGLDSVHDLTVR